jgi:hypothetical protein
MAATPGIACKSSSGPEGKDSDPAVNKRLYVLTFGGCEQDGAGAGLRDHDWTSRWRGGADDEESIFDKDGLRLR